MKKSALFFVMVGVIFVSSCVSVSHSFAPTIAFSIHAENAATGAITRELKAQVAKGAIKNIVVASAEENTGVQLSKIASFVNTKSVDVLLIQVSDELAMQNVYEIIQSAHSSIPIIFLASDESIFEKAPIAVRSHAKIGCIVMFGLKAGEVQGQFVNAFLRGRGKVGLLVDKIGSASQIYRTRGFEIGIQNTDVIITHQEAANSKSIAALKIVKKWMQNETGILDAVVTNDSSMALGAALALEEQGLEERVLVIGGDMSDDVFTAVKAGNVTMTLALNASEVVRETLHMVEQMTNEKLFDKTVEVAPLAITAKNVDMFLR